MSDGPPKIPENIDVDFMRFYGSTGAGIRIVTASYIEELIQDAQVKARTWVRNNPGITIISIDTAFINRMPVVTVWYT